MGELSKLPNRGKVLEPRYTYADYLAWDESDRIELIGGEVFMRAAPSRIHQEISAQVMRQLTNYLDGKKCKAYAAPFAVRLFGADSKTEEGRDTVVEPDIVVVCDMDKLDSRGCTGAPDMIMEILSPSTLRHDRFVKLHLYRRAGVREYWIIDPLEYSVQVYQLDDEQFTPTGFYTSQDIAKVNVLQGCYIELSRVFPKE